MITRMLATYSGVQAHVIDAMHEPKSLNLDALPPAAVENALPVIADRCVEVGRDPATRPVSAHLWGAAMDVEPGLPRQRRRQEYAEVGLERVIVQGFAAVQDPDHLEAMIDDCGATGLLQPH